MALVLSTTRTEIATREIGLKTKNTDGASTDTQMGKNMQESGTTTRRKASVELNFRAALGTKEGTLKAKNTAKASACTPTESYTKVNFITAKCKGMEYTHTRVRGTLVTGCETKCTGRAI